MIDLEKMSKEHETLFPNATAESQFVKMEEEKAECREAYKKYTKELADVLIVCAGIYRYNPNKAIEEVNAVYNMCALMDIDKEDIETEVNRKWQVNLGRKWEWNGKTYKHVGKDGNE